MKDKCKTEKNGNKKQEKNSLPLGSAYSTVGGSSKVMLREAKPSDK